MKEAPPLVLDPKRQAAAQGRHDDLIRRARHAEQDARRYRAEAKRLAHTWDLRTTVEPG